MSSSTDDRIPVGRIGRPHGVRGEVTVLPESDDPARFAPGARVWTGEGRELVVVSVSQYRARGLIVGFEGVGDRAEAERLRGSVLSVPREARRDLDRGEFWPDDLIGLEAVTPDGRLLGVVGAVDIGAAQDRLVVRTPEGRDVLVPFVAEIVGDPKGGRLEIRDPGGLFE
ncbi:MAG: ribosome maturation factor RimM [Actinomycetota bacterium]|nr:ribosome maturation factor RimM [Actinomycetota bacterium]